MARIVGGREENSGGERNMIIYLDIPNDGPTEISALNIRRESQI
jgi:hypothetical protein